MVSKEPLENSPLDELFGVARLFPWDTGPVEEIGAGHLSHNVFLTRRTVRIGILQLLPDLACKGWHSSITSFA